ncbi:MAG: hypothetical protein QNK37_32250 [Acidobacteriota bacterium]|nr:hypothetical protein [Acidobacteriota bacterium]
MDHFKDLERRKQLEILNFKQLTKRALMMKYEELKLMFLPRDGGNLTVPRDLIKKADYFNISKGARLMIQMSTFTTEDPALRWNIMSQSTSYKLKGGDVRIEETVEEQNYKKLRTCSLTLIGPAKITLDLKDSFVKDRVVDPKTVVYTL